MKFDSMGGRTLAASVAGVSLLAAAFLLYPKPAASQNESAPAKEHCIGCSVDGKTTPRMPDGHPNLNGFWDGAVAANAAPVVIINKDGSKTINGGGRELERSKDGSILFDFGVDIENQKFCGDDSCQAPNQPPYKPEYMAKVKEIAATEFGGTTPLDPQMDCKPLGVPRAGVNAMQIVQTLDAIAILYEGAPYSTYRLIYTDGRGHPDDPDPTYMGDSIGHWEGDTLVVDVVALNDETWLGGGVGGRNDYTSIHSDKEHVIERWTRDGDVLTYQATVDDPVMFTRPWVLTPRRVRIAKPDDLLWETACTPDKAHFIKPSATDKDIQNRCAFLCTDGSASK